MTRAGGGRPTTDQIARVIGLRELIAAGLLSGPPGHRAEMALAWSVDGVRETMQIDADIKGNAGVLRLLFSLARRGMRAANVEQEVVLATTATRFGGVRWWFRCPITGRRVLKLYRPSHSRTWASRHHYGLGYASQRQGENDRRLDQSFKLRRRLDPAAAWADDIPARPLRMWARTYARRVARIEKLECSTSP